MRARWPLVLLCLSCGRSCGCLEGETTYEHIDEPIKVELVRDTHWVGSKIPGPMSSFYVRVHASPSFDEPTTCTHAQLAENDVGTLVAFRCKDDKPSPWTLIRLGHSGRHFRDCVPLLGEDDKPSFAEVRPLSYAAAQIIGCFHEPASQTYDELFERLVQELHETEGDAAVVRFLVESASSEGDAWTARVLALSAVDRAAVLRQVCPTLRDASSTPNRWEHAAVLCPLEDSAIGDAALERVRRGFADASGDPGMYWDSSFLVSAAIAMRTHGADVGDASCAYVGAHKVEDVRIGVAYTAIAVAKTTCPAIMPVVQALCDESIDCDGGLCSQEMLRPELQQWADQTANLDGGSRTYFNPSDVHRSLLAAAWAQGPLPGDFTLTNARRNYTIDLGAGLACWERAEAGLKCACSNKPSDYDLCTLQLDAGRFESNNCSFLVDDKKKTIADPRHACGAAGAACIQDNDCCVETTCQQADGGIGPSHCR